MALELLCQFLSLISALMTTFLVKIPQNCPFCIQLSYIDIIDKKIWPNSTQFVGKLLIMAIIGHWYGSKASVPKNWVLFFLQNGVGGLFNKKSHIIISRMLSWIQKVQFCDIFTKNMVVRADIRLKNWRWSSNAKKMGFILL